jgi:hypothetical protein
MHECLRRMLAAHHLRRFLSGVLLLLLLSTSARAQTTYRSIQDVSSYGWLDQFSLNTLEYNFVGAEACVPTSSVNTMTYLQNSFSSYFGTNLTGTSYADWINVDATLISPDYMNTGPKGATNEATAYNHLHFGLNKYVVQDSGRGFSNVQFSGRIPSFVWDNPASPPPEERPATIADSLPTWQFLYDSLISGSGTVLGLTYTNLKGGHAVSLGGFDWTDSNGNGRIDFDENAQLHFVDPLDPTRGTVPKPVTDPSGSAQFTTGKIWEVMLTNSTNASLVYNTLELAYEQYVGTNLWGGASGGSTDYGLAAAYLTTAVAMTVPEPSTYALLAISTAGLVGFVLRRRRP